MPDTPGGVEKHLDVDRYQDAGYSRRSRETPRRGFVARLDRVSARIAGWDLVSVYRPGRLIYPAGCIPEFSHRLRPGWASVRASEKASEQARQ